MYLERAVGPLNIADTTAVQAAERVDRTGARVVSDGAPRYYENTSRGLTFSATNAATSQAFSTLLNTTYVGLSIANPIGSGKNLAIVNFGIVNDGTVSGAIGGFAIGGSGSSAGVIIHGTPLAALWGPNLLNATSAQLAASAAGVQGSVAQVDSACTWVGTPHVIMDITGGAFTTAPTSGASCNVDVAGLIVVAPGGAVGTIALIASMTHFVASFCWMELPQ